MCLTFYIHCTGTIFLNVRTQLSEQFNLRVAKIYIHTILEHRLLLVTNTTEALKQLRYFHFIFLLVLY